MQIMIKKLKEEVDNLKQQLFMISNGVQGSIQISDQESNQDDNPFEKKTVQI